MEFLLILSALLSAATGALTGARGPEAGIRHEAAVETVATAQSAAAAVAPAAAAPRHRPTPTARDPIVREAAAAPLVERLPDTDRLIE